MINYLAKCELKVTGATEDIYGNLSGGKIELKDQKDLKAMKIGCCKTSATILLPNFIKLDDIILYDLAGLGDNRGPAVLILNIFVIKNIIENAFTVKLIFVTST